jgi:hypothetical protein
MRPHSDPIIGRAFRRSLAVLAVIALAAAGVWLYQRPGQGPRPADGRPVEAPRQVERPAQEMPAVRFVDVTQAAGIGFVHVNGARGEKLLPETMGSGAAFVDFDGDGDPDLLLVNSGRWADDRQSPAATAALYRNDGTGRFEDVTAGSGLDVELYGMGVATGDYDGDGRTDVFITAVGEDRMFHNEGGGRFRDVTAEAGVAGSGADWGSSAAFLDYDGDGDLDLFVGNYVRWSREIDFEIDFRLTGIGRAYGPPTTFEGSHPYLYRNEGNGRFTDVSAASGVQVAHPATGRPMAKTLGVLPVDLDRDGWLDIYLANDTVQKFLLRNRGDGSFEERGASLGVAFDRNGAATGAMGVDAAHYRNDEDLGVAVGNFANEMSSLYVTQGGQPPYTDEAINEGLGPSSRQVLTFGLFFFDYDLDGRLDLLQANGHLEHDINRVQPSQHYEQPAQIYWNCGPDCQAGFVPVPGEALADLATPRVGRGASYADIDGDGDLDVLITQNGRPPALLRNDQATGHHWLRVRLEGSGGNREAIGARVEVTAGGVTQRQAVMPSRSYLSQVELPLTFGLGQSTQIDAMRVIWPDGTRQDVAPPGVDSPVTVRRDLAPASPGARSGERAAAAHSLATP